jgi:hypothetical protein
MFNAPAVDPLSPGPSEALGISGAEYLLLQLEVWRRSSFTTVQLIMPEEKVFPALSHQTEQALQRYADCRVVQQQLQLRETRRHGWRLAAAAIVLLAFFLTLSSLVASEWAAGIRPLYRRTLEYGFEIVGWVMLWYPIEVLVYQPIAIKGKIRALRKLAKLRIVVVPEGTDTGLSPL